MQTQQMFNDIPVLLCLLVGENNLYRRNMKRNNSFLEEPNQEEQSLTRRGSPNAGSKTTTDWAFCCSWVSQTIPYKKTTFTKWFRTSNMWQRKNECQWLIYQNMKTFTRICVELWGLLSGPKDNTALALESPVIAGGGASAAPVTYLPFRTRDDSVWPMQTRHQHWTGNYIPIVLYWGL